MGGHAQAPIRVWFLCTGDSAGPHPAPPIHPLTAWGLGESSIAHAGQYPKRSGGIGALDRVLDDVITTCNRANEAYPVFPRDTERIHRGFENPAAEGTKEQHLCIFRHARDEIKRRAQLFTAVKAHQCAGVGA